MVIRSGASPTLVDTYHLERHAVGVLATEQAYTRWKSRFCPSQTDFPDGVEEVPAIIIELGHRYEHSPAISYSPDVKATFYEDPFWPTAQSGSRAPHVWFRKNDRVTSLYDYFDIRKFILLCSRRGTAWHEVQENFPVGWPLKVAVVSLGEFFTKYEIRDTGAVLVRPDGVIAWKAISDSDVAKLRVVLAQLLGLKIGIQPRSSTTGATATPIIAAAAEKGIRSSAPPGLLKRMTFSMNKRGGS